jgi:hypothetical protein
MANSTSRLGQRPFKSLLRECNAWLADSGLRVVDWSNGDLDNLETIDADDWDAIPCLRTFHKEMRQKHAPELAETESA